MPTIYLFMPLECPRVECEGGGAFPSSTVSPPFRDYYGSGWRYSVPLLCPVNGRDNRNNILLSEEILSIIGKEEARPEGQGERVTNESLDVIDFLPPQGGSHSLTEEEEFLYMALNFFILSSSTSKRHHKTSELLELKKQVEE